MAVAIRKNVGNPQHIPSLPTSSRQILNKIHGLMQNPHNKNMTIFIIIENDMTFKIKAPYCRIDSRVKTANFRI